MRLATAFLIFAAAAGLARADSASIQKAREVLTEASAVAQKLTAISYEGTLQAEGPLADRIYQYQGRVVAVRGDSNERNRVLVEGTVRIGSTAEPSAFTFACDGHMTYQLDEKEKLLITSRIDGSQIVANNGLVRPYYLNDGPFQRELSSGQISHEGVADVAGIPCDVIAHRPNASSTPSKLYIGVDDRLLHRADTALSATAASSRMVFTAANIKSNPDIDGTQFRVIAPPGYQRKDLATLIREREEAQQRKNSGLLEIGAAAPDFELTSSDGTKYKLSQLRGKVILLDFWASWCGPCKRAMPGIQKLHEHFKGKPVHVFGMNCREKGNGTQKAMDYAKAQKFTYTQLINSDTAANAYKVVGIPTFYVIDANGKIAFASRGYSPIAEKQMQDLIEQLIKNKAS